MTDEHRRPPASVVLLDGMPVSAVRVAAGRTDRFEAHPNGPAAAAFGVAVLGLAVARVPAGPLRDRLAWCGQYVAGRADPRFAADPQPRPEPLAVTRMLVLGTPDERADFHRIHGARPGGHSPPA